MLAHEASIKEANAEVLQLISSKMDTLLMLCETDSELRNYALKFKLEQAVDKTAFQAKREEGEEILHFWRVLQRMANLALHVAPQILRRTTKHHMCKFASGNDVACDGATRSGTDHMGENDLHRSSSVEEFCDGSEAWMETGAHLSQAAVELLCLILVSHPRLVKCLQMYLLESDVLVYITEALGISREQEIAFFQEGFRTEHVRLIANLTLDNEEACSSIVGNTALLSALFTATRYDAENPGMVEWAEFSIRNLCQCSSEAREKIRRLMPVGMTEEGKEFSSGGGGERVDCHTAQAGRCALGKQRTPTE